MPPGAGGGVKVNIPILASIVRPPLVTVIDPLAVSVYTPGGMAGISAQAGMGAVPAINIKHAHVFFFISLRSLTAGFRSGAARLPEHLQKHPPGLD